LVSRGIDSSRIVSRGYGKEFGVASNTDSAGRQLNRRVEVVIGGENGAAVTARSHS
jgi:outer membrane protein OmpA-like peptidoglycan-associated protein